MRALNFHKRRIAVTVFALLIISGFFLCFNRPATSTEIVSYVADPTTQNIQLYWKDANGAILGNFKNLKNLVESKNKELIFAMNGGMYKPDLSAQGLFIENKKTRNKIDKGKGGNGNFYLRPNGVFYITDKKKAVVCETDDFKPDPEIVYATQSGPMLLINEQIHSAFKQGSFNLNIRNGVGILPDGKIVFAISKKEINFYDFAMYFKNLGCKNALYLDGFVSMMYLPEKNLTNTGGIFGVMIGITKDKK